MEIWFTSDHHFNHTNIIKYQNRPFANIKEMNETLIEVWNVHIKPSDLVYHIGDFVFHSKAVEPIVKQLNGNIYLISGNHDLFNAYKDTKIKVEQYLEVNYNKQKFILFHYPIARWRVWYYGSIHLHGHCHGNFKHELATAMDVGVDTNKEFRPYHIDEIIDLKKEAVEMAKRTFKHD